MIDYNEQFKELWRKAGRHPKTSNDWSRRAPTMHPEPFLENSYTRTFLEKLDLAGCDTVLDLGCGVGNLLIPLASRLQHGWGVDYSPGMLEEARKKAAAWGAQNLTWVEADWRSGACTLPGADLVLASRSLDAEDMRAALTRLNGWAGRRVYLTYRVGRSYLDESLLAAVERDVPPRPDHHLLMKILEQMGLHPKLDYIQTDKTSYYESAEALHRRVEWTLGALTQAEQRRLDAFYERLPADAEGLRRHDHGTLWAFIAWEKE